MHFLEIIKNTILKLYRGKSNLFKFNLKKQKVYITKFNEPKDDIERSYFQYKCQMFLIGRIKGVFINIACFFLTYIYIIRLLFKTDKIKTNHYDAVFLSNSISRSILPDELEQQYSQIKFSNYSDFAGLTIRDLKFIKKIVLRYPLSWYFIFKCMIKIAIYSSAIKHNNPKAILTYSEYSFTSSILTKYCEERNVTHINLMHGEKLFYIRDSFFRFHKFFIWDNYYKNLFTELRAFPHQFILCMPKSMKFSERRSIIKTSNYTYYLANETKEELVKINNWMLQLMENGCKAKVRPHPRYSDLEMITDIFNNVEIEDFCKISIEKSLLSTNYAISLYSTVLNQAYSNGIDIVIDNKTNLLKYKQIKDLKYIMVSKDHLLLSDILD